MQACGRQRGFRGLNRGTYNTCGFLLEPRYGFLLCWEVRIEDVGEDCLVLFTRVSFAVALFDLDDLFFDLLCSTSENALLMA